MSSQQIPGSYLTDFAIRGLNPYTYMGKSSSVAEGSLRSQNDMEVFELALRELGVTPWNRPAQEDDRSGKPQQQLAQCDPNLAYI